MELYIDIFFPSNYILYYLSYWGTESSPLSWESIAYFYFKAEWHTQRWAEQRFVRDSLVLIYPCHLMMCRGASLFGK